MEDKTANAGQDYVVGFLFSNNAREVVLIRKKKPEWQRGRLNGVGGKIEPGESPKEAMIREFEEEAGVHIEKWARFCTLTIPHNKVAVYFFWAVDALSNVRSVEAEQIEIWRVCGLREANVLDNLHWLIPMALDDTNVVAQVEEVGDRIYENKKDPD